MIKPNHDKGTSEVKNEVSEVEVEATGRVVHWVHVKGHSADGGNDAADERVQWGKENGPFARLRNGGGEGDSRFGAVTAAAGGATDVALGLEDEIELDSALEALLDDANAHQCPWRANRLTIDGEDYLIQLVLAIYQML